MKIALITDQHFGVRNDSPVFHDFFEKFYTEFFFPYLSDNNISEIIDLGDTFDRRKYISFYSLSRAKKYYYEEMVNRKLNITSIVGNHVIPYRNTLSINALDLLLKEYSNVKTVAEPKEVVYDDTKILLVPWICDDNYDHTIELIAKTDAQIVFGHLELGGFEMYKGAVHDDGMDSGVFQKFDVVCSGHYHHKSSRGNIHYLGCPYEMTWSDYNDTKGFHIFDTETRELTFVENPYRMFFKLIYDDTDTTLNALVEQDFSVYKNTYVKVIVKAKNNPYWFDMFIDKLEKAGTVNIQVVDDHLNLNLESDDNIVNETEDTLTILRKYVDNLELDADKAALDDLMRSLYEEALSIE